MSFIRSFHITQDYREYRLRRGFSRLGSISSLGGRSRSISVSMDSNASTIQIAEEQGFQQPLLRDEAEPLLRSPAPPAVIEYNELTRYSKKKNTLLYHCKARKHEGVNLLF